jgi:hypothetical protein
MQQVVFVILNEVKDLGQILRFAQNDNWPMALSAINAQQLEVSR